MMWFATACAIEALRERWRERTCGDVTCTTLGGAPALVVTWQGGDLEWAPVFSPIDVDLVEGEAVMEWWKGGARVGCAEMDAFYQAESAYDPSDFTAAPGQAEACEQALVALREKLGSGHHEVTRAETLWRMVGPTEATRIGWEPGADDGPVCDAGACGRKAAYACECRRCASEEVDERFYTCPNHHEQVEKRHLQVRGREALWVLR